MYEKDLDCREKKYFLINSNNDDNSTYQKITEINGQMGYKFQLEAAHKKIFFSAQQHETFWHNHVHIFKGKSMELANY